jgi:gluconate 2-dehydrogenase gamma chain
MTSDVHPLGADSFFDAHERATIEAAMGRIIPTDESPGALEAGTIDFLERYLSGTDYIYATPDGSGFQVLEGRARETWQYRVDRLRSKYRAGVIELCRLSRAAHGSDFAELNQSEQDEVLREIEASGFDPGQEVPEAAQTSERSTPTKELQVTNADIDLAFLPMLVAHTRQGFYCDPIYGGNRDRVGWDFIGFPGPASLADVHEGRYTTIDWFAENLDHPLEAAE